MTIPAEVTALLSTPAAEVKPPAPLPAGPYIGVIASHEFLRSTQKQTPFVRFTLNITGPAPGNSGDFTEVEFPRQLRYDFYLTAASLYRLADFQTKVLGLPENNTVQENIALCNGRSAIFNVVLKASNKPGDATMYPEVTGAAAL